MASPTNPIARLDVPLPVLEQEIAADVVRKAAARSHSPSDRIAYALDARMVAHPEVHVADDADYADTEWAAWLAERTAASDTAWAAAHTKTTGDQS